MAAPLQVLVAQRNPEWAHFYFVREHWQRFTTTEHGRGEPWWYFIPIIAVGLFPWTGCLWTGFRSAVAGGWKQRRENADTWFFILWAVFLFLFFSKSQSKLVPYILPVFPPLAVVIGISLAEVWQRKDLTRIRGALWFFCASAGLLGIALGVVLLKPGLVADAAKLLPLRPGGLVAGGVLLLGTIAVARLTLQRNARAALVAVMVTVGAFYLTLAGLQDKIVRPGTKAFALRVSREMGPRDRVYHYHDFFHDFTYYAERPVGTIAANNTELEFWIDPDARTSGRFIDDVTFRQQWEGPDRLWVVARKRAVDGKLFSEPGFRYHLLGETATHYLFSNQP